jgi:two-component system, NtrC family, sensor kinase
MAIGVPLPEGIGVAVIELGSDYRMLRNSQQIAMGYLFLNFLILFSAGLYRLNTLITRPIHRFIRLTDNYRSSEAFDLFPEKHNDEFSRLSSSLNRMLRDIDNDRKVLEQSIGEIERAHHDLKTAQQEIIKAEKLASIGRLSAGIAHEIGNPIGIVLGYLGLLKNRSVAADDRSGMDYIERAEQEINRINNIIRQLLDFSRSTTTDFTIFHLHDLLYDTGRMLSQQPLMENIRIFFDFSASNDAIYGDYNQMHQVIVNLIINAADSISTNENVEDGAIRLVTSISTDDNMLCIEVVDNGGGVPVEFIDKVFDPFFTTKETGKGTGLGLYVCYMIIERFGGSISLNNNEGAKGSRVVIQLPLSGHVAVDDTFNIHQV